MERTAEEGPRANEGLQQEDTAHTQDLKKEEGKDEEFESIGTESMHTAQNRPAAEEPSIFDAIQIAESQANILDANDMTATIERLQSSRLPQTEDYVMEEASADMIEKAPDIRLPTPELPIQQQANQSELPPSDDIPPTSPLPSETQQPKRRSAFAKLEFPDGDFYMTTTAVMLGRDEDSLREAQKQYYREVILGNQFPYAGLPSPPPRNSRQKAQSIASLQGGCISYTAPGSESGRRRRRGTKSAPQVSPGSSIDGLSRRSSVGSLNDLTLNPAALEHSGQNGTIDNQERDAFGLGPAELGKTTAPAQDDVEECFMVPIHPSFADPHAAVRDAKGISRRHAKIEYDSEKGCFELHVLGSNGVFIDGDFIPPTHSRELFGGDLIQISSIFIRFVLPNLGNGTTTMASETQSAMSFDFHDGRGESVAADDRSDSSSASQGLDGDDNDEEEEDEDDEEEDEERRVDRKGKGRKIEQSDDEDEDVEDEEPPAEKRPSGRGKGNPPASSKTKLKLKNKAATKQATVPKVRKDSASPGSRDSRSAELDEEVLKSMGIDLPMALVPPRKKGPGRPPKNGVMSKREEAVLRKLAKENARASASGPMSEALQAALEAADRRKSSKKDGDVIESIEGNDGPSSAAKPAKEKKSTKPPRSPSPYIDEASLTPEQLAKPSHSYVIMIHEALSACAAGVMSLPQIYKAIERKYPYFRFKVTTVGWQSSIRHNLSQHDAFIKTETREGKGWMWALDPNVPIEKEKRPRRASPPPMQHRPGQPIVGQPNGIQRGPNGQPLPGQYGAGRGAPQANGYPVNASNPYLQGVNRPGQPSPLRQQTTANQVSAGTLDALDKFKRTLMETLPMDNKEAIIDMSIAKVLGRPYTVLENAADQAAADAIQRPLIDLVRNIRHQAEQRQLMASGAFSQGSSSQPQSPQVQPGMVNGGTAPRMNGTAPQPPVPRMVPQTTQGAAVHPSNGIRTPVASPISPATQGANVQPPRQTIQQTATAQAPTAQVNGVSQATAPIALAITTMQPAASAEVAQATPVSSPQPPPNGVPPSDPTTTPTNGSSVVPSQDQLGPTRAITRGSNQDTQGTKRPLDVDEDDDAAPGTTQNRPAKRPAK